MNDFDSPKLERLDQLVRRLQIESTERGSEIATLGRTVDGIYTAVSTLQATQRTTPPAPVANLIYNGELGHSTNSWYDAAYTIDDKAKECAWFWSHFAPFAPQTITTSAADTLLVASSPDTGALFRVYNSGGALPTGLVAATNYYWIKIDATHGKVASSYANALAGTPIAIAHPSGSGTNAMEAHLDETDARTSSISSTLKDTPHSTYDNRFGRWDSSRGEGLMQGTRSIDAMLPSNFVDATIGNLYVSFVCARRTQYISIPAGFRMGAGLWDATPGQNDWLTGDVGLSAVATISGAPTVSRKYRLFVQTDRGYTILSNEVTINAPDDGQYNVNNYVTLEWRSVAGFLQVQVLEFTPSTGVYRVLEEVSGPSSYIDNGSFRRTISGYPAATDSNRKAVFYSTSGNFDSIAVDGGLWDTYFATIGIPDNYNKGLTTGRQWLRIFQTVALDLFIEGVTTDGTTTINFPAAIFEADFSTLYPNLEIIFYDVDGNQIKDTTIASRTDTDTIVVASAPAAGSSRQVRIVGGGFHGIRFDKVHAGYHRNVSFAPNPNDNRALQPVAAPNGSSQGGPGDGGGGGTGGDGGDDRGGLCVTIDTPIAAVVAPFEYGDVPMSEVGAGYHLKGENCRPNAVSYREPNTMRQTRYVETENGCWKRCTEEHRFRTGLWDSAGVALKHLHIGDLVMTQVDGRDEMSPIRIIGPLTGPRLVGHVRLSGGRYYLAGRWRPRRLVDRVLIRLGLRKMKNGKIYAHNEKQLNQ